MTDFSDLMQVEYSAGDRDCWWLARTVLHRLGVCDAETLAAGDSSGHLARALDVPAGTAAQRGDVLLMRLPGDMGGQHVAVCLDAFRAIHATSDGGVAVVQLAVLRRLDRGARLLRLAPQPIGPPPTWPTGGEASRAGVQVSIYDDILSRKNRRWTTVPARAARPWTIAEVIEAARSTMGLGAHTDKPLLAALNGRLIEQNEWGSTHAGSGDEVIIAPRPGELSTVIFVAIAIASAAASAYLVSRVRHAPPTQEAQRRFAFGRFSSDAVVGDVIPVFFGTHPHAGGKTILKVPGEGENGDTRIRILTEYGRGRLAQIGSLTADTDGALAAGLSGFYYNDQPLSDLADARVSVRMGTADQLPIPGFDDTETLREVGVGGSAIVNTSGAERTGADASGEAISYTTFDAVDAVSLRIRFPRGLFSVSASGQTNSRRVRYRHRWRLVAGVWSAWTVVAVERADQSEFISAVRIDGVAGGGGTPAEIEVQVERVSVDATNAADVDDNIFDSVREIQYAENAYAGKALLAIEFTASEQLTSVPRVSADIRGYADLRIWDGLSDPASPVFVTGYSDNPAWIALELMTNATWGAGAAYTDDDIDFSTLIEWAVYAAEAVPRVSGGGTRPRFACNLSLREQRRAIDWLRTICRTGRCQPATTGNVWRFVVDRPRSTAVETFSDATIALDDSGAALVEYAREVSTRGLVRPTRWVAQFSNQFREGRDDTIGYPELGTLWLAPPSSEPLREESVRIEGVTDPEQIAAELIYLGKRIRGLARTVTFTMSKQVPQVQPGDRFDLACSLPGWGLASGRVLDGCTTTSVLLDRSVTLAEDTTYVLRVIHVDGTVEDREVTAAAGDYDAGDAIGVEALAFEPSEFEEYVLGEESIHVKPFVCTRVALVDFERLRWEISGVEYDDGVYDDTPGDITLPDYSVLRSVVTAPGPLLSLTAEERTVNGIRQVVLSWRQAIDDAENTGSFRVYRRATGTTAWVLVPDATPARRSHVIELADLDRAYEFRVVAVSIGGAALSPNDPRHPTALLVYGLSQPPPPPPTGVVIAPTAGNTYTLSWDAAPGAVGYQVLYGGDAGTGKPNDGAEDCLVLARTIETQLAGLELAPGQAHRFWVRSEGANSRLSETAATVLVSSAAVPAGETIKHTRVMDLAGEGTASNTEWNAGLSRLVLINPAASAGGSWTSPEITPGGGVSLTELTLRPATANHAADPAVNADPFRVPSIAADQWGVVSIGPPVVGMLMPPWPDNEQAWHFDVRTHDGAAWSAWETVVPCASIRRSFGAYQVRVTMSRRNAPYRPALRGVTAVLTH